MISAGCRENGPDAILLMLDRCSGSCADGLSSQDDRAAGECPRRFLAVLESELLPPHERPPTASPSRRTPYISPQGLRHAHGVTGTLAFFCSTTTRLWQPRRVQHLSALGLCDLPMGLIEAESSVTSTMRLRILFRDSNVSMVLGSDKVRRSQAPET